MLSELCSLLFSNAIFHSATALALIHRSQSRTHFPLSFTALHYLSPLKIPPKKFPSSLRPNPEPYDIILEANRLIGKD
jgi:hypothetical protein